MAEVSTASTRDTTVSLKEWGAVVHALLQGRQRILLRKGGIHERVFEAPAAGGGRVLLFPTVAHTHAERTRPEHHDLLDLAATDATDQTLTIRTGVAVTDVIEVARPDALSALEPDHIWTTESIVRDRVEFRPRHPLQVLVVQPIALPEPLVLPRVEAYAGCRSWIDLHTAWEGEGTVVDVGDVAETAARVRDLVG